MFNNVILPVFDHYWQTFDSMKLSGKLNLLQLRPKNSVLLFSILCNNNEKKINIYSKILDIWIILKYHRISRRHTRQVTVADC